MVKVFNSLKRAITSAALLFVGGFMQAVAQNTGTGGYQSNMGSQVLESASGSLRGLVANMIGFLQILLGIAALVSLFVVIYNVFKQERDAAQKAIWWVVGLAAGWAAMTVVGSLIGNNVQVDGGTM